MNMEIYRELGERIEGAFEREGRALRVFPRVAAEALREARIPERSSADDVLAWVFGAAEVPPQNDLDEAFGEPPITVYRGRDFHVEVLFWLSTVTTVHGHGFSGAFQALSGERLQTRHAFDAQGTGELPPRGSVKAGAHAPEGGTPAGAAAMLGTVRFVGAELLSPGDVVEITHDLVHAIVHLAEPSATIVVRTSSDPDAGPQLDYRAPWVAHDPFLVDEPRLRKIQALRLLCRSRRPDALSRAAELVSRGDLATCLGVLSTLYRAFRTEGHITSVIDAARERHGAGATAKLLDVLREERRLRAAHALRGRVTDPDQRFFLALLHHVPSREEIVPLIAARFPGEDPIERAEALAVGLSGTDRIGVDFDDALTRALVHAMLHAGTPDEVRGELAKVYDPAEVHAQAGAIDRHAARIRRTVLAPLFRARREGESR